MQGKNTLWRLVMLALLLYALAGFASARSRLRDVSGEEAELQEGLFQAQQELQYLQQRLNQGMDADALEAMARERLGLVLPGEKVFYFIKDREDKVWVLK